jgi:hypothetical protein
LARGNTIPSTGVSEICASAWAASSSMRVRGSDSASPGTSRAALMQAATSKAVFCRSHAEPGCAAWRATSLAMHSSRSDSPLYRWSSSVIAVCCSALATSMNSARSAIACFPRDGFARAWARARFAAWCFISLLGVTWARQSLRLGVR